MRGIWLSIHPRWITEILQGAKTVELRRRSPTLEWGASAVLYSTSPECAVVATATVERVDKLELAELWLRYSLGATIPRTDFDAYFKGCETGVALTLGEVAPLGRAVGLRELRAVGESPAQGWRYIDDAAIARLALLGSAEVPGHSNHTPQHPRAQHSRHCPTVAAASPNHLIVRPSP